MPHREIQSNFLKYLRVSHSFRLTAPKPSGNILMQLPPPTPNFGASFARKLHPREGEKAWAHSRHLPASGTTCTPACSMPACEPMSYFEWSGKGPCMTGRFPKDTALSSTLGMWRHSIGICWGIARSDCGLFSGPLTSYLHSELIPWGAGCHR